MLDAHKAHREALLKLMAVKDAKDEGQQSELLLKGINAYANFINLCIDPIKEAEIPFLIYILETVAQSLRLKYPKTEEIIGSLKILYGFEAIHIPVNFTPEEGNTNANDKR